MRSNRSLQRRFPGWPPDLQSLYSDLEADSRGRLYVQPIAGVSMSKAKGRPPLVLLSPDRDCPDRTGWIRRHLEAAGTYSCGFMSGWFSLDHPPAALVTLMAGDADTQQDPPTLVLAFPLTPSAAEVVVASARRKGIDAALLTPDGGSIQFRFAATGDVLAAAQGRPVTPYSALGLWQSGRSF